MNKNIILHKEVLLKKELLTTPKPIQDFFRRISSKSINTRMSYFLDLKLFFDFLISEVNEFENLTLEDFSYDYLNKINLEHVDLFKDYLLVYEKTIHTKTGTSYTVYRQNNEWGVQRKLSTLRSFFSNLYELSLSKDKNDQQKLLRNFSKLIDIRHTNIREKYRMTIPQIKEFLDVMEKGYGPEGELSQKQKATISNNYLKRDLCIVAILAETGIRISELINLDFTDIYIDKQMLKIIRKGGKEDFVYYKISEGYILDYLKERKNITAKKGSEKAFFLSSYKGRITTRGVQKMIKKYGELITHHNISPHTFRRSFATNIYEQTGDIYLVASLIGDTVEVAAKHYTKQNEGRKREAINSYISK